LRLWRCVVSITALWDVTPCTLVGRYQNFRVIDCFHMWNRVLCLENEGIRLFRNVGMCLKLHHIPKVRTEIRMPRDVSNVMVPYEHSSDTSVGSI
jgi:hypothetical protein